VLHQGETISQILARAGGVTADCHLAGVVYTRPGEGRVLLDMTRIVKRHDRKEDIAVMDGDRVHFPRIPETIQVTGAVFQPGSIKFLPGKKPGYYIGKCGGYLDDADPGGVRVVQADGSVGRLRSWWPDPEVRAGALVDVPLRTPSVTDWGNVFRDVTGTLASLVTLIFFTQRIAQ
jgi:polysaccharide export outer membrane protein